MTLPIFKVTEDFGKTQRQPVTVYLSQSMTVYTCLECESTERLLFLFVTEVDRSFDSCVGHFMHTAYAKCALQSQAEVILSETVREGGGRERPTQSLAWEEGGPWSYME